MVAHPLRWRSAALPTSGALLALTLGGCAVAVARADLEAEIARGEPTVTDVTCAGDLDGTVAATQDCTATREDGSTIDVLVTVVEVRGSSVEFELTTPGSE